MNKRPYLNGVLTVLAVLMLLNLLVDLGGAGTPAMAQSVGRVQPASQGDGAPLPFNAAEQRKTMIAHLEQISSRLARLETKLEKGINVKVTDMPAIKMDRDGEE